MTARLQQSSILDWAQSQHQSAASGTGMDSSRAHYRPSGPGPSLGDDVWVLCNRIIRVLVPVLMIVHMHRPWPPALQTIASWERPHFWSLFLLALGSAQAMELGRISSLCRMRQLFW